MYLLTYGAFTSIHPTVEGYVWCAPTASRRAAWHCVVRRGVYAASLSRVRRKSRNGSHFAYTDGHGSRELRKVLRLTHLNRRLCAPSRASRVNLLPFLKNIVWTQAREANTWRYLERLRRCISGFRGSCFLSIWRSPAIRFPRSFFVVSLNCSTSRCVVLHC